LSDGEGNGGVFGDVLLAEADLASEVGGMEGKGVDGRALGVERAVPGLLEAAGVALEGRVGELRSGVLS